MPPKIEMSNDQKIFISVSNKYVKQKALNLRETLPMLFQVQFGKEISYSTMTKYFDQKDIDINYENELFILIDRILSNNNQALNESNILPSETHCSESINSIDVSINSNNSSKSYESSVTRTKYNLNVEHLMFVDHCLKHMQIYKAKMKGKTANQILEHLFKCRFPDETFATISSATLRYRHKKAIKDEILKTSNHDKMDIKNINNNDNMKEIISTTKNSRIENENIEQFSQELEKRLSLKPNQTNPNFVDNYRMDFAELHSLINEYSSELNEFLKPLIIETGRIDEYSFRDFLSRFNLKECHVNNDDMSIISCIRLFLKIVHGQELNLDQVYRDLKEVNQELILKVIYGQELNVDQVNKDLNDVNEDLIDNVYDPKKKSEFFKEYIQWIEQLFFYGIFENRLLNILPHIFKLNLFVLDTTLEQFVKIDFYGVDTINDYLILKEDEVKMHNNQSKLIYSFLVPTECPINHSITEFIIGNLDNSSRIISINPHNISGTLLLPIINENSNNKMKKPRLAESQTSIDNDVTSASNVSSKKRRKTPLTYRGQIEREKTYKKEKTQIINEQKSETNSLMTYQNIVDDEALLIPGTYTNANTIDKQIVIDSKNSPETFRLAYMNRDEAIDMIEVHSVGVLGGEDQLLMCVHCNALFYADEVIKSGKFTLCCMDGKIKVPIPPEYPHELKILLYPDSTNRIQVKNSKEFLQNARAFNAACSFGAVSARIDTSIRQNWNFVYKIQGNLYRSIAPVKLDDEQHYKLQGVQYFILDTDEAHETRVGNNPNLSPSILKSLEEMIRRVNPYAKLFENYKEQLESDTSVNLNMFIHRDSTAIQTRSKIEAKRYNPNAAAGQIAAVFTADDEGFPPEIFIAVKLKNKNIQILNYRNPHAEPLCYSIFLPHGTIGYFEGLKHIKSANRGDGKLRDVSLRESFCFRYMVRGLVANDMFRMGKLLQQNIVDAYTRVEKSRLEWYIKNQKECRVASYQGLIDHLENLSEKLKVPVGSLYILPSSFVGGMRYMRQAYQDAMAMVRKFGKPDLFITFTANPNWPEIVRELNGQPYTSRPDICVRVIHLKLKSFLRDLIEGQYLGKIISHIRVIEFQMRGLPHCHLIVTFAEADKVTTPEQVDEIIWAEIPDPVLFPELHDFVIRNMRHTCDQRCLNEEGKCKSYFPKPYSDETIIQENGITRYKRRFQKGVVLPNGSVVTNQQIVPYNPFFLMKYNCHINFEWCSSIKSVKYLFSYLFKGHDLADIQIKGQIDHNEIDMYVNGRSVTAFEGIYRIYAFDIVTLSHSIERLPVHEENMHILILKDDPEKKDILKSLEKDTQLMAWFKLNQSDEDARKHLYDQIPYFYRFVDNKWQPRQRKINNKVVRLHSVSPKNLEIYSLRVLLLHVPGATSFKFLKTVDGYEYPTFREAAIKLGLISEDDIWRKCLIEAVSVETNIRKIRLLFATICIHCQPINPSASDLWEIFKEHLIVDFLRRGDSVEVAISKALRNIKYQFEKANADYKASKLPEPDEYDSAIENDENATVLTVDEHTKKFNTNHSTMNRCQLEVCDDVVKAIENPDKEKNRLFFVDGPGGTGKTYLLETLIHYTKSKSKIVVPVAYTGIAASLLEEGQTIHSKFGVPLNVDATTTWRHEDPKFKALKECDLILWDEVSMCSKHIINGVDRFMRDLCQVNLPFGGKYVVFAGDFRQTLPIVKGGNNSRSVSICFKNCQDLWPLVRKYSLAENMRASEDPKFSDWLLNIGNGTHSSASPDLKDYVQIPNDLILTGKTNDLASFAFNTKDKITPDDISCKFNAAILTPLNEDADKINALVLERMTGEERVYLSSNKIITDDPTEADLYPIESIFEDTPSGYPHHKLALKVGCVVMLLKNVAIHLGLCNGTRMKVIAMHSEIIECEVLYGRQRGQRYYISKHRFMPDLKNLPPCPFERVQFPLKLAFAMTINKSQGQTFDRIALYLPQPVFAHGQLYVAFSRVRRFDAVKVLIENKVRSLRHGKIITGNPNYYTKNVVCKAVLTDDVTHYLITNPMGMCQASQEEDLDFINHVRGLSGLPALNSVGAFAVVEPRLTQQVEEEEIEPPNYVDIFDGPHTKSALQMPIDQEEEEDDFNLEQEEINNNKLLNQLFDKLASEKNVEQVVGKDVEEVSVNSELSDNDEDVILEEEMIIDQNEVVSTIQSIQVTQQDLGRLCCNDRLNDNVIQFYIELLIQKTQVSMYAFATNYYSRLDNIGFTNEPQRWVVRELAYVDKFLVPIYHAREQHWSLVYVDTIEKNVYHFDSLFGSSSVILNNVTSHLNNLIRPKLENMIDWNTLYEKQVPKQQNGIDCGVFVCLFARHLILGRDFNFTQRDISNWRKIIEQEIVDVNINEDF